VKKVSRILLISDEIFQLKGKSRNHSFRKESSGKGVANFTYKLIKIEYGEV